MDTLIAILPMFILIGIGYAARRFGVANNQWVKVLNGFVYYISLPALIVTNLSKLVLTAGIARLALANISYLLVSAFILWLIAKFLIRDNKLRAVFFTTAIVSNSVYLGIPIIQSSLTNGSKIDIVSFVGVFQLVLGILISLIVIEYDYLGTKDIKKVSRHLLSNPLMIGIAVGLSISLAGYGNLIDSSLASPLRMLATTASPLALFTLGSFLYGHNLNKHRYLIGWITFAKLLILPTIAALVLRLIRVETAYRDITVTAAAMPTAVTAFVLSKSYKLDSTIVANAMLVTTVCSIVSLSILISLQT